MFDSERCTLCGGRVCVDVGSTGIKIMNDNSNPNLPIKEENIIISATSIEDCEVRKMRLALETPVVEAAK